MQDQPDQTTLSKGNDPDSLIMSEARDATAIDNLEDTSFDFHGGVRRLIETLRPNRNINRYLINIALRQVRDCSGAATT